MGPAGERVEIMRFRFTLLLLIANVALFFGIWILERDESVDSKPVVDTVPFTVLEISGGGMEKPRIIKLENNKWRITSPINWPANLFAVNRIRNQLEFLGKETSFPVSELSTHGHGLADYGLENPSFILRYGNGSTMYTLKIGKNAPVGDRVYMLDENAGRVVVVDRAFVDGLVLDMESLRNQSVFDIPAFEVSAISIRIPEGDIKSGKISFRRIGLIKDGGKWKFETPIVAAADPREVDAFLNELCQISAKGFPASAEGSFDASLLPTSITIQGTNRRQVLLLGSPAGDDGKIYARLEDNPTVFILDEAPFKNLGSLQTTLRDKRMLHFEASQTVGLDISKDAKSVKLRKLKSGVWDVIGTNAKGDTLTAAADLAVVNDLLSKLEKLRARNFVSDISEGKNYGFSPKDALQIVITQSDQSLNSIKIGSEYKYGGANLMYAAVNSDPAVYGISKELSNIASTDFYHYRSRILEVMPSNSKVVSIKISDAKDNKQIFYANLNLPSPDSGKLGDRGKSALKLLSDSLKKFTVKEYLKTPFSTEGAILPDSKKIPWAYVLGAEFELQGTGSETSLEKREWYLTERTGGTTQYGGYKRSDAEFILEQNIIDALAELTTELSAPESLSKPAPKSVEPVALPADKPSESPSNDLNKK